MASSSRLAPETGLLKQDWDHITRPTLQRLTSSSHDLVLAALGEGRGKSVSSAAVDGTRRSLDELGPWKKKQSEGQREALVHEVERGDTVAGIALQYGLSAQALRQANRLWSSDSIHLRKTLYIPLDSCTMPPAKELIERIEVEGDQVTIFSRALPRRPAPLVAPPPPKPVLNGVSSRRSASLDLERLPTSSRTSMESNASFYLPETNTVYTEAQSPTTSERLVEVEEPPAPLKQRTLKLGLVPLPPSTQPFFRLSPSGSTSELGLPADKKPARQIKPAKAEAVPMKAANGQMSSSGWSFDDESELAMAADYMRRTTKGKRA